MVNLSDLIMIIEVSIRFQLLTIIKLIDNGGGKQQHIRSTREQTE